MKLCLELLGLCALASASHSAGGTRVEVPQNTAEAWFEEISHFLDAGPVPSPVVVGIRDAIRDAFKMEDPLLKDVWIKLVHLAALGVRQAVAEALFWSVEPPQNFNMLATPGMDLRSARQRWYNVETSLAQEVDALSDIFLEGFRERSKQRGGGEPLGDYSCLGEFILAIRSYCASRPQLPQLAYKVVYLRWLIERGDKMLEEWYEKEHAAYMKALDTVNTKREAVLDAARRCVAKKLLPEAVVSFMG